MHRLLLFYVPFVMVNLALDFYVLWHGRLAFLTLDERTRRRWRMAYGALQGLIYLSLPLLAWLGWEQQPALFRNLVQTTVLAVLVFKVWALPLFVMEDLRRACISAFRLFWGKTQPRPIKSEVEGGLSRGAFLSRMGYLLGAVPLLALGGAAVSGSAYRYRVHFQRVVLQGLPSSFKGKRLVQLSDLHTGSWDDPEAIRRGIQMVLDLKPDILVFTGDLVNTQTNEVDPWMDILRLLKAPMGVYSVLGNHDYGDYRTWLSPEDKVRNFELMLQTHKDLGWQLLRNQSVTLAGEQGEVLELVGCENWGKRSGFGKQYGDIQKAMAGVSTPGPHLLLTHDPSHFDRQVLGKYPSVALTLSGHTHGMQMGIDIPGLARWSPASWVYPHWAGHYDFGDQQLYVNRGFGFVGFRGRLGIFPEITCLELG
ncbi:MAG: metallophosphoesterase [Bacteroidia bacterium]